MQPSVRGFIIVPCLLLPAYEEVYILGNLRLLKFSQYVIFLVYLFIIDSWIVIAASSIFRIDNKLGSIVRMGCS